MNVDVMWRDNSQTILEIQLSGDKWLWYVFDRTVYEAFVMMGSVNYGVVLLLNLLEMRYVSAPAIKQIDRVFQQAPPNMVRLVIASEHEAIEWHFTVNHNNKVSIIASVDDLFV